jgi:hypothetical protein
VRYWGYYCGKETGSDFSTSIVEQPVLKVHETGNDVSATLLEQLLFPLFDEASSASRKRPFAEEKPGAGGQPRPVALTFHFLHRFDHSPSITSRSRHREHRSWSTYQRCSRFCCATRGSRRGRDRFERSTALQEANSELWVSGCAWRSAREFISRRYRFRNRKFPPALIIKRHDSVFPNFSISKISTQPDPPPPLISHSPRTTRSHPVAVVLLISNFKQDLARR